MLRDTPSKTKPMERLPGLRKRISASAPSDVWTTLIKDDSTAQWHWPFSQISSTGYSSWKNASPGAGLESSVGGMVMAWTRPVAYPVISSQSEIPGPRIAPVAHRYSILDAAFTEECPDDRTSVGVAKFIWHHPQRIKILALRTFVWKNLPIFEFH
jgi:hypothetical protein